jgi:hypothetical protein
MIQRRQSLYLLLAAIVCILLLVMDAPVTTGTFKSEDGNLFSYHVSVLKTTILPEPVTQYYHTSLIVALVINILISVVAIFSYAKRGLQLKLVAFNFLFIGLQAFYMLFNHYNLTKIEGVNLLTTVYQLTLIAPLLLAVLNILALRGIKKDIELLASVDRLR